MKNVSAKSKAKKSKKQELDLDAALEEIAKKLRPSANCEENCLDPTTGRPCSVYG